MAGPKEEWLIWAEECQHHIKSINERLNNISLPTDQLESLSEKLKDIIATCSQLQDENNALQDRVLRLEQEINEQDQINAVKSQQQEQLKAHFKTQESEFDNVIQAVSRMQRTNAVEREQYQREMKELRDLVEGLVSGGQINSVQARPRASSNATTADESMLIDQEFDAQPANAAIPQGVSFSAQGAASLEQYLKHADMLMQPLEAQAIKEFLNGMHINHQRSVVKGQLKTLGWTWHNLKCVVHGMVADTKKRKETRRVLAPPF